MRSFATDRPEFMRFTLGNSKKVHKMPLAKSMPMDLSLRAAEIAAMPEGGEKNLASLRFEHEVVSRYLGDAADGLTSSQVHEIFIAWSEESASAGASLGE